MLPDGRAKRSISHAAKTSDQVRECLREAEQCAQRAKVERDPRHAISLRWSGVGCALVERHIDEYLRADPFRVGFETHACLAMRRESSMTEAA